jgi:hypothetical protein
MARSYARIDVQRFHDADWRALPLAEKAVFDMMLTHPKLSLCGALDLKYGSLCGYAPDLDVDALSGLLEALEEARFVAVDWETDEMVFRTFVRHDGVLQNQNLGRGMWSAWVAVESPKLRQVVLDNLPELAFEERFKPPVLALSNGGSNGSSNAGSNGGSNYHNHNHTLQPASADRSIDRFEHVPVDNQGPTVRLAQ